MIIYCREHARSMGKVNLHGSGSPQFVTRSPRWRDRHSAAMGHPDDLNNSWTNLREWTRPEVRAWCRVCGDRPIKVTTLLAAFEGGRASISV